VDFVEGDARADEVFAESLRLDGAALGEAIRICVERVRLTVSNEEERAHWEPLPYTI
jgi:hypothetical protein